MTGFKYSVIVYSYSNKQGQIMYTGSHNNCLLFRDEYLSRCILDIEGICKNFDDYISDKKIYVSKYDYAKNRVYISKSLNNPSKLTLNKVVKLDGYLLTDYKIEKLVSVSIVSKLKDSYIEYNYSEEFNLNKEYEDVISELNRSFKILNEEKPIPDFF